MDIKERADRLKADIPAVAMALKKKETPLSAKILAGITVAYALSPIDLIPDFIPVLGYLDDIILLPVLVKWTILLIPEDIMEECRRQSKDMWKHGKPVKWYYAAPIVVIWAFVICLVIKAILPVIPY